MSTQVELVERYFAIWNETDVERRHELIKQTWSETASYLDPLLQGDGHDGINAMVQGFQEHYAGHQFHQTSGIDAHHDRLRFGWELAPVGGAAIASGTDFGIIAPDGRLQAITGFFEPAPATEV